MKKTIEKNNDSLLKIFISWLFGTTCGRLIGIATFFCMVVGLVFQWFGNSAVSAQTEVQKAQAAVEFRVEINEVQGNRSWIDQKAIWNNRFSRIISIKNNSDNQVILSNSRQKGGYEIFSQIEVFYESLDGSTRKFLKKYDFNVALEPQKSDEIDIDIELPEFDSGEIVIEVKCIETKTQACKVVHDKKRYGYKKNQVSNLRIIFVDATKKDDPIEVQPFRKDIQETLQVTGGALKAVYSKSPFPLKHEKPKEAWGGAVLLYNPIQGHSANSDITLKIRELLLARYSYVGDVILAEYNAGTVKHYGAYLSECKPYNCISTSLEHEDLNLETNLFSKDLYQENPKEDFMIFLPYNN